MDVDTTLLIQIQTRGIWVDAGYLHGTRDQKNWFEFSESYWTMRDRPVLGQIFEERGRFWQPSARVAIPHWFSHLLPEGRLRQAVADAAHVNSRREFELLRRLGATDLPGAVRAIPAITPSAASSPDLATVEEPAEHEDPLLKFSLAGVQLKFSVYGDDRGLTVPAHGQAGNVILKFPDGRPGFTGVPEAELASLELARAAGIDAPKAFLIRPSEVPGLEDWARRTPGVALAVSRFDRGPGDLRIHMEEIAQVMDIPTARESAKYRRANFETIAVLVEALAGSDAVGKVIDRIVLNVLLGNGDAHLKNWAVLYPDGRLPILSPVYDVVPTVLFMENDDLGLRLGGTKKFADVTVATFEGIGSRTQFGVPETHRRVHDAIEKVLNAWPVLGEHLAADAYQRLTERRDALSLLRE
ncbi:type II toxin-antitoxin system HipA family toxin [Pseudofrankia sp. BMG5.37]|uniref:type II toxin-antitoxin system HipA family toxin n=1 Tax=Pseudofrankia sp. BMG5.37 TaxID=3050035 RepID=UPI002894C269|nr:type II toxin-antitoxin system HipA family toxin [Pseudofrankia sp. BMG5.37]MDT3440512.1 type II toxin-antitoxin system HipA family toxin [Pseudofrankia sp. BMG5.37]